MSAGLRFLNRRQFYVLLQDIPLAEQEAAFKDILKLRTFPFQSYKISSLIKSGSTSQCFWQRIYYSSPDSNHKVQGYLPAAPRSGGITICITLRR